jgi:hypothetical protein
MQIRALYDQNGKILAAVHLDAAKVASHRHPQPHPRHGQSVGDFTVPDEYTHFTFEQACAQLVVSGEGKHATLAPKSAQKRRKGAAIRT